MDVNRLHNNVLIHLLVPDINLLIILQQQQHRLFPPSSYCPDERWRGTPMIEWQIIRVRAANDPSVFSMAFSWLKATTSAFTFKTLCTLSAAVGGTLVYIVKSDAQEWKYGNSNKYKFLFIYYIISELLKSDPRTDRVTKSCTWDILFKPIPL